LRRVIMNLPVAGYEPNILRYDDAPRSLMAS